MCCEAAPVDKHYCLFLVPDTHFFIVVLKVQNG